MNIHQSRIGFPSFVTITSLWLACGALLLGNNNAWVAIAAESSPIGALGFDPTAVEQPMTPWNDDFRDHQRQLQLSEGKCWSTRDDRKPNRYCLFDDTPRSGAFLSLSCPTTRDGGLQECKCTIGIGESKDAPDTDTCWKCGFCRDGSLAYDCRNVAEGTCVGRNCLDDCLSSYKDPEDLLLGSSSTKITSAFLVPSIVAAACLLPL